MSFHPGQCWTLFLFVFLNLIEKYFVAEFYIDLVTHYPEHFSNACWPFVFFFCQWAYSSLPFYLLNFFFIDLYTLFITDTSPSLYDVAHIFATLMFIFVLWCFLNIQKHSFLFLIKSITIFLYNFFVFMLERISLNKGRRNSYIYFKELLNVEHILMETTYCVFQT